MTLGELLKPITNNNEIDLKDFVSWFNTWMNDLCFCTSVEERDRIQSEGLKAEKTHDEIKMNRLKKERQKSFMDLGVWSSYRSITVYPPIRDRNFTLFSFSYKDDKIRVAVSRNSSSSQEWFLESIIYDNGKTIINEDDARLLITTLINNWHYLPSFGKHSKNYKLFIR